jgi:hypothetical protein
MRHAGHGSLWALKMCSRHFAQRHASRADQGDRSLCQRRKPSRALRYEASMTGERLELDAASIGTPAIRDRPLVARSRHWKPRRIADIAMTYLPTSSSPRVQVTGAGQPPAIGTSRVRQLTSAPKTHVRTPLTSSRSLPAGGSALPTLESTHDFVRRRFQGAVVRDRPFVADSGFPLRPHNDVTKTSEAPPV